MQTDTYYAFTLRCAIKLALKRQSTATQAFGASWPLILVAVFSNAGCFKWKLPCWCASQSRLSEKHHQRLADGVFQHVGRTWQKLARRDRRIQGREINRSSLAAHLPPHIVSLLTDVFICMCFLLINTRVQILYIILCISLKVNYFAGQPEWTHTHKTSQASSVLKDFRFN